MARERKQDILNELTDLLGLPRRQLRPGGGSSLPGDVFVTAAQRVGVASGGAMPVVAERVAKKAGTPWLARYDSRHTRSGGGSTVTRDGLRAFVDAVRALLDAGVGPQAFLILWNPARWEWLAEDLAAAIAATAAGQLVERSWSTGGRILGIEEGDRAYLLRQGNEPRGIVAAGWFQWGVYQDAHWYGSDRLANYADIDFDAVVDPHSPVSSARRIRRPPCVDAVFHSSERAFSRSPVSCRSATVRPDPLVPPAAAPAA